MTDRQKQCLLEYLGYDCGGVDGVWGEKSRTAAAAFQRDHALEASRENLLSVICRKEDWWSGIRHFTRQEFACRCGRCGGFPAEPEERLVRLADEVREHFGAAALVSSGVRCMAHNAAVGGVANSRHLSGKAMDFRIKGKSAGEVLNYVNQQPGVRYAYAIDSRYIHMDVE